MAAPWVERFLLMLPHYRAIDLLQLCDAHGLALLKDWMLAVAARPSVQRSSAGHEEMCKAAIRYYVRYISPGAPGTLT